MKYSIRQIKEDTMTAEKQKIDKIDWVGYLVERPISFLLTPLFLRLKMSANAVSALSIIPCVVGFFCLGFGHTDNIQFLGVGMYLLWAILDCVDGNIARYNHSASKKGELFDAVAGYCAFCSESLALGLAAFYETPVILIFGESKEIFIILGSMIAIFQLLPRLLLHKKQNGNNQTSELQTPQKFNIVKIFVANVTVPGGLILIAMIIAICFQLMWLLVLGYFIIFLLICCVGIYDVFK